MTHIPYGYSIVDGKAVIDEEQAAKVRMIFSDYLSGMSLAAVAAKNGLKMLHSRVGQLSLPWGCLLPCHHRSGNFRCGRRKEDGTSKMSGAYS